MYVAVQQKFASLLSHDVLKIAWHSKGKSFREKWVKLAICSKNCFHHFTATFYRQGGLRG